jgi:hypothetical protein
MSLNELFWLCNRIENSVKAEIPWLVKKRRRNHVELEVAALVFQDRKVRQPEQVSLLEL